MRRTLALTLAILLTALGVAHQAHAVAAEPAARAQASVMDITACLSMQADPLDILACVLAGGPQGSEPQALDLAKLRAASATPPLVRFTDGFPRSVIASVPAAGDDPVEQARTFLAEYAGLYGQLDEALALPVAGEGEPGTSSVRFEQMWNGFPVYGASIVVTVVDGRVRQTAGALMTDTTGDPEAEVTMARAEQIALADAGPGRVDGATGLVVFSPSVLGQDGDDRLAWRVTVRGSEPMHVLVDARTEDILWRDPVSAHSFDLDLEDANGTNAVDTFCYWTTTDNDQIGNADGVFSEALGDAEATTGFAMSKGTYDFYKGTFDRDSWDDEGEELDVYVHVGMPASVGPNAGWVPGSGCDLFEFSDGFAAQDVMTHEFTHAVITDTSDLAQGMQPGALNESYSDLMAVFHTGDWLMGEDIPNGPRRNVAFPTTLGDPDRMSNFVVLPNDQANDFGGVHTNAGIPNRAAFVLAAGGNYVDVHVPGIGVDKTKRLYYSVMRNVPGSAQFIDARDAKVGAAITALDAAGAAALGVPQFSPSDVCSVRNAFFVVELGDADRDCDGNEDLADGDDDADFKLDGQDNCPTVSNPTQKDTDGDGDGDACDTDDDDDGELDSVDNCPLHVNPDQADADSDGKGDPCDDVDHDGVPELSDNCPDVYNPGQQDDDGDDIGNLCDDDLDNDGVLNHLDNCMSVYNPDQLDSDGGGWGDACDDAPYSATNEYLHAMAQQFSFGVQRAPAGVWKAILKRCIGGCPEDRIGTKALVHVDIGGLSRTARVWVSDERGKTVSKFDDYDPNDGLPGGAASFTFAPKGSHTYVLHVAYDPTTGPGTDQVSGNVSESAA